MEGKITAFVAFVVLVGCFYKTDALKCYEGTGQSGLSDTMEGCTVCMKQTASVSFIATVDTSTRTCVTNGTCVEQSAGFGGVASEGTYCCKTDLCNSAATSYISSLLSFVAALIFALRSL